MDQPSSFFFVMCLILIVAELVRGWVYFEESDYDLAVDAGYRRAALYAIAAVQALGCVLLLIGH